MDSSPSPSAPRETWFASPDRSGEDEVVRRSAIVAHAPMVDLLLNSFPVPVLVVDPNRQIVACNRAALEVLGGDPSRVIGRRPGEVLNCIHANDMPAGCGTSLFCAECGAGQALHYAIQRGTVEARECRILARSIGGEHAYDFRVHASPLRVEDEALTLFAIQDIADEKRRQALERIFFHDVLNTASAIDGLAQLIAGAEDPAQVAELSQLLGESSTQLIQEIFSQRDLLNAERGELTVTLLPASADDLLRQVHRHYATSLLREGRGFQLLSRPEDLVAMTDAVQAVRCLGNLVKNALEATPPGGTVTIWAEPGDGVVRFCVRNPGVIPDVVQLQMFQRSFSTKAAHGRGIGTYSVKLLVEGYLGGHASFVSNGDTGDTVFTVDLPAADVTTA